MQVHQLMDAGLFALSFWLAFELRSSRFLISLFHAPPWDSPFDDYEWLYVVLILASPFILEGQGFYKRPFSCSRATTLWLLFKGCFFITLGLITGLFLLRLTIARWIAIWFGGISFLLVWGKEELVRLARKSKVAQAQYRRRFILAGARDELVRVRRELAGTHDEIEIVGQLNFEEGSVSRLVEMLHEMAVNGVIVSARRAYFEPVEAVVRACELEGVEVWLMADFFKTQISRTSFDEWLGKPVMIFRSAPETSWQGVLKQVLDYVLALGLLIVLAPVLTLLALVIKFTSPGPVLFRQQRSGLNGRPFTMFKFRTMVTNAEQLKHELAALNEMSGPVFKVTNDPRITPVGKFLRKFSLDEFPQLFNVLRGEMSLVGPRPLPVDEVERFDDVAHRRRLSVKPGLTCLWQVSGRNHVADFGEWVRLDLEYIDNWSLWLDLAILCRTVPVVVMGTGAK